MKKKFNYDYSFDEQVVEKKPKKKTEKKHEESFELKTEHVFAQLTNDVYKKLSTDGTFLITDIERSLITNLSLKFNKSQIARLTGLSARTIRNKFNEYRLGGPVQKT